MKKNNIQSFMMGLAFAAAFLTGCDDAEYSMLRNQAYVSQTNANPNTALKVFIDQDPVKVNLNVRMSDPAAKDMKFELVEDAALLEEYNKTNFTAYQFLPAEQYLLVGGNVDVKQGHALSEAVELNIQPLTQEMKDSGNKYAVALTLRSKDGESQVLQAGGNIVYLLDPAIMTSVPVFNATTNASFELTEDLSLNEWTLEFCINMSKLGQKVGDLNNQALFDGSSRLGEEDGQIYTRFGDAMIEGNRLQIKTQGIVMDSKMQFEVNKWYHVAFVHDASGLLTIYINGVKDVTLQTKGGPLTFTFLEMVCSGSTYFKNNCKLAQVRLWRKAITPTQIISNMYYAVKSWKLDEGQGNMFEDCTGQGRDMTVEDELKWEKDVRFDK